MNSEIFEPDTIEQVTQYVKQALQRNNKLIKYWPIYHDKCHQKNVLELEEQDELFVDAQRLICSQGLYKDYLDDQLYSKQMSNLNDFERELAKLPIDVLEVACAIIYENKSTFQQKKLLRNLLCKAHIRYPISEVPFTKIQKKIKKYKLT